MITINISPGITKEDILLQVDNTTVDFSLSNNLISFDVPLGVHKLTIRNVSGVRVAINNVAVNGSSLRKLLYLSWSTVASGQRFQPCTELWEVNQEWTLPVGIPLSSWITSIERKIPNNLYGKDLSSYYHMWIPESVKLNGTFPSIITDFFSYDNDCTVLSAADVVCGHAPYMEYQGTIDNTKLDDCINEVIANASIIANDSDSYSQSADNQVEFNLASENMWKILWLAKRSTNTDISVKFPRTMSLIQSLGLDYRQAFVAELPPGGFIYPHTDDMNIPKEYDGCTNLYIPIKCPQNNYIKIGNAGTILLDKKPWVLNTNRYTHAVVNDSGSTRYILSVGVKWSQLTTSLNLPLV